MTIRDVGAEFVRREVAPHLQQWEDGGSIPRELPADVRVADKPGSLEAVRTDSGIVFAKDRPFVISVMTTFDGDEKAAERTISRIAAAAYRYFDRLGRSSPYGRAVPPR